MAARSLQSLFDEYSSHHRNETNIIVHWICVPVIFFSVIGFLMSLPAPMAVVQTHPMSWIRTVMLYPWACLAAILVIVFYVRSSIPIAVGMTLWIVGCIWLCAWIDFYVHWPLWAICLVLFAAAWIGQFWGHKIEGQKPSFLKDLTFLLIGPAWLMAKAMRKVGIAY